MSQRTASVPEVDLARIRQFCIERSPARVADLVRLEFDVDRRAVTILECRPPWSSRAGTEWSRNPVARLRYIVSRGEWTLYWSDRHGRFHRYHLIDPAPDVRPLLVEIDADPTCIFWG